YWALLTMGPLLIGASLTLSSYAFTLAQTASEQVIGSFVGLSRLVSILLAAVGFALVYFIVPNRAVALRDALTGAVAAAVALEGLKALFGLYIANFSSYALVYGALAAIPIFLLWMYAFWVIVLGGAEIAAAMPEWRVTSRRDGGTERLANRLALALSVLCRLAEAHRDGASVQRARLLRSLPATPSELDESLSRLRRAHLIQRTSGDRMLLARDLSQVDLESLLEILGLRLHASIAWPEAPRRVIQALDEAHASYRKASLASLLDDPDLLESTARLRPVERAAPLKLDEQEEAGTVD
ncbi:MAG: YihY family inner membrane protein, partial [Tistlia sp.]